MIQGNLIVHQPQFTLKTGAFRIEAGLTCVFGNSGSGKTTFLQTLAGLNNSIGELTFNKHDWNAVPAHRRGAAMVFQQPALFPHLNVESNLRYALNRRFNEINIDFEAVIEIFGLEKWLKKMPHTLSGGQAQRVAMARAVLSQPNVLLMDEPMTALDNPTKQAILPYIKQLKTLNLPIIYVTHSLVEVEQLADTVMFIENGQILEHTTLVRALSNPNSLLNQTQSPSAMLEGIVTQIDPIDSLAFVTIGHHTITAPLNQTYLGETVRLLIAANHVSLMKTVPTETSLQNIHPVTITAIQEATPHSALLYLSLAGVKTPLLAEVTRKSVRELKLSLNQKWIAAIKGVSII